MSRRGWIAAIVVVALAAAAAVAIRHAAHTRPGVAVVGDSITVFTSPDLVQALTDRYQPDIRATVGARTDQMLTTLQAALRNHPRAAVVNLGTNDALQADLHPDWRAGFRYLIALLAPVRCVVFVTVSTAMAHGAAVETVARDYDTALDRAAAAHRNFHILNWDALVRAPAGPSLLETDRIHPSDKGRLTLALETRRSLDANCRGS